MKLAADAVIAGEKITRYLLRWRPEDDKSAFLAQAGYHLENADQLQRDLQTQLLPLDAKFIEHSDYGPKYRITGPLRGPTGETLQVTTIWMIENASQQTKFITLYPAH